MRCLPDVAFVFATPYFAEEVRRAPAPAPRAGLGKNTSDHTAVFAPYMLWLFVREIRED